MMASTRLVILVVSIVITSTLAIDSSRILGGVEADKTRFAYVGSLRLDDNHYCGASIIGPKSILTAAHCVEEFEKIVSVDRLSVRVGSTNKFAAGKIYDVANILVHPDYAAEKNNVAVLILASPLEWSNRVTQIKIATSSADEPAVNDLVTVAGWGEQGPNVSSYKLHSISFSIASDSACSDALSEKDESNICLAHDLKSGSCMGDAGNGAVYNNKLVGVSSYVVGACGSRYPDVFSNVTYYAPWIKSVLV